MVLPADTTDPLPPGGNCRPTRINVVDPNTVPFQLTIDDVATLQVQNERRLIVLTAVSVASPGVRRLTFSAADTLVRVSGGPHRRAAPHAKRRGRAAAEHHRVVSRRGHQHARARRWLRAVRGIADIDQCARRGHVHDAGGCSSLTVSSGRRRTGSMPIQRTTTIGSYQWWCGRECAWSGWIAR